MHPVAAFLAGVPKRLTWLIPLSMLAGLATGLVVDMAPAKAAILPVTMLMVYPMLVNFRIGEAVSLRGWKTIALAMAINFLLLPLAAWGLATLFFSSDPGMFVGMVLVGLIPTSGMTISWTGFAKGNVGAAVKMTVIGLLLASVLAPLYLLVLGGTTVEVDALGVARTILLVVFVPMVAGTLTRKLLVAKMGGEAYRARVAKAFPGLSAIGVIAIVFLAIALKAEMIVSQPAYLLGAVPPLLLFYVGVFVVSTWAGRALLDRPDAVATVYGTAMRNLSIALGIAIASFGPEAALLLAVAYVIQVPSAAWYVKLSDRVLGDRVPEGGTASGPA